MKNNKLFRVLVVIFCLALFTQLSFSSPANFKTHTYHTSLTRIDYNPKEQIYEITIQLFTHDLIPLLEKMTKNNVDLDKKNTDAVILNYIKQNFALTDEKGESRKLKWVGKEVDTDTVWIYVETPATQGLENYHLQNTIFFESFPEQTNLVVCRYDGKKADLLFKVGDKSKIISAK